MAFLTSAEVMRAAASIDALSAFQKFTLEVEMGIGNPLNPQYGWHEFYPSSSIRREDLDELAARIAAEAGHIVEIKPAPEPLIFQFFWRVYGPKGAPLIFRVHLSPPRAALAE